MVDNYDGYMFNEELEEIVYEGKINKISEYVEKILRLSDNRIFMKFDEK